MIEVAVTTDVIPTEIGSEAILAAVTASSTIEAVVLLHPKLIVVTAPTASSAILACVCTSDYHP